MTHASGAYHDCRKRITEIASELAPSELTRAVPACPEWTITDLIAHLVGVAEDFAAGNIEEAGKDEWTRAQIARRSERAVPALIHDWEAISKPLDSSLDKAPAGVAAMLIGDAITHEHDLRAAVDRPGARDSDALWIALDRNVRRFGKKVKDARLPSVLVRCEDRRWQAGVLEAGVELEGDRFELLRALTGRRTIQEIASLSWSGDPGPYLELVPGYPATRYSLRED